MLLLKLWEHGEDWTLLPRAPRCLLAADAAEVKGLVKFGEMTAHS